MAFMLLLFSFHTWVGSISTVCLSPPDPLEGFPRSSARFPFWCFYGDSLLFPVPQSLGWERLFWAENCEAKKPGPKTCSGSPGSSPSTASLQSHVFHDNCEDDESGVSLSPSLDISFSQDGSARVVSDSDSGFPCPGPCRATGEHRCLSLPLYASTPSTTSSLCATAGGGVLSAMCRTGLLFLSGASLTTLLRLPPPGAFPFLIHLAALLGTSAVQGPTAPSALLPRSPRHSLALITRNSSIQGNPHPSGCYDECQWALCW